MPTVLIVEDSDSVAPLEIALASLHCIYVSVVQNGRDALKLLDSDSELAAVVTDLNLPCVDGFELIVAIRAHDRYSKLPIIVISGESDEATRRRVRELGANAFFTKPYSPSEIRSTLESLLYAA